LCGVNEGHYIETVRDAVHFWTAEDPYPTRAPYSISCKKRKSNIWGQI